MPLRAVHTRFSSLHPSACRTACLQEAAGRARQRSFFGRMLAAVGGGPADPRAVLASLDAEVAALERLRQALHAGAARAGASCCLGRTAGEECAGRALPDCQPCTPAPSLACRALLKTPSLPLVRARCGGPQTGAPASRDGAHAAGSHPKPAGLHPLPVLHLQARRRRHWERLEWLLFYLLEFSRQAGRQAAVKQQPGGTGFWVVRAAALGGAAHVSACSTPALALSAPSPPPSAGCSPA